MCKPWYINEYITVGLDGGKDRPEACTMGPDTDCSMSEYVHMGLSLPLML